MKRFVLVAGIGNIFLSDDGFGPEVARHLIGCDLPDGVEVVDYGIRGMHLAYDLLDGCDGLVIIDALPRQGTPGEVVVLEIGPDDIGSGDFDAHGMEPVSVLASLGAMGGELPPTYLVGCEPESVEEGMGLTPVVAAAVAPAAEAVIRVLTGELRAVACSNVRIDNEGELAMKVLGYVFLVIIAAGVLGGIVMTLVSIPDIRRYLRIRSM